MNDIFGNLMNDEPKKAELVENIRAIIEDARSQVKLVVNSAMVLAYWEIGRLIVEDEQKGDKRAVFQISDQLTTDYGKGFDVTNLRKMRQFFLCFPKRDALRLE